MNKPTSLKEVSLISIVSLDTAKETLQFVNTFLESKKSSEKLLAINLVKQLNSKIKSLEPVGTNKSAKVLAENGEKVNSISLTEANDILTPTAITVGALPIGCIFIVQSTNKEGEIVYTKAHKTSEAYGSSASLAAKSGKRTCGCALVNDRGAKNYANNVNIFAVEVEGIIYPVSNGMAYKVITYLNMIDTIEEQNYIIERGKFSELVNFDTCIAKIESMEIAIENFEKQYSSLFNNKFPKAWNKVVNYSTIIDKAVADWDTKLEKFEATNTEATN